MQLTLAAAAIILVYAALIAAIAITLFAAAKCRAAHLPMPLTIVNPFKDDTPAVFAKLQAIKPQQADWILAHRHIPRQFIFVNDHSSEPVLDALFRGLAQSGVQLLHNPPNRRGKKHAIHTGMLAAHTEWVLTSDSDTRISPKLSFYLAEVVQSYKACLIPIAPAKSKGAASALFAAEFMVLQGVGVAFAKWGRAILANGAALLIQRDAYFATCAYRKDWDINGGDDLFTIFAIQSRFGPNAVGVLLSLEPSAEATFGESLAQLWRQRLRWIAKVPDVSKPLFTAVAWLVVLANLCAGGLLTAITLDLHLAYAPLLLGLKFAPEIAVVAWGVSYFRRWDVLPWILPMLVVYPFYITLLAMHAAASRYIVRNHERWR